MRPPTNTPERAVHIHCQNCGEIPVDDVKFEDIQSDIFGNDVLTFRCTGCNETRKSKITVTRLA